MNKLSDKAKTWIALACAFILIGVGAFQGITGIEFNEKITSQLSLVLMIIAAYMIFSKKKRKIVENDEEKEDNEEIDEIKE